MRGPGRTRRTPMPAGRVSRFDATGHGLWTAAQRLTTSPQAQQPQQKRSTHLVHKPVKSECARQAQRRADIAARNHATRLGHLGFPFLNEFFITSGNYSIINLLIIFFM